jgi:hypothetical protein
VAIGHDDQPFEGRSPLLLDNGGHAGGGLAGPDDDNAAARFVFEPERYAGGRAGRGDGCVEQREQQLAIVNHPTGKSSSLFT